jgi:hypothetical protein
MAVLLDTHVWAWWLSGDERLKDLARARKLSVTKLFDEMATVLIAEYDAETRFRARAARGAGRARRGLRLLAKARGEPGRGR